MKTIYTLVAVLVVLWILSGCATGFHRQKYTDFGHVRGMRFREPAPEKPTAPLIGEEVPLSNEREARLPEVIAAVPLTTADSPEAVPAESMKNGSLPAAPPPAIVAIAQREPADTIRRPPAEPVDGDDRFFDLEQDIRLLSFLAYALLVTFVAATICGFAYLVPWFAWLAGFALLSCFIILFIVVLLGSRYRKTAKRDHYPADRGVLLLHHLNGVLLVLMFLVTLLALLYLLLVMTMAWS